MFGTLLQVALGGAIGASARFAGGAAILRLTGPGFPVAIIAINVAGSFLMGVFVVISAQKDLAPLSPFVMTGVLGGFTTFSAFSLEAFTLFERGLYGFAALYVVASVALSLVGMAAGVSLARAVWA